MRLKSWICLLGLLVLLPANPMPALESNAKGVHIKDIATLEGVRDNPLVGYGLVVGLNGMNFKTPGSTSATRSFGVM